MDVCRTNHPREPRPVRIVGVACGAGAGDPRCAGGPAALRRAGLVSRLRQCGLDAAWSTTLRTPAGAEALPAVSSVAARLSSCTHEHVANSRLPLVLGGDHSCAIGTWKGVARALAPRGPLGLIWIDAHLDAHTPETTQSGMLHGMPVASLLGYGDARLAASGIERLDPRRVCLVGARSFERGEAALLARLGVRTVHMHEVRRRGLASIMTEALAIARGGTAVYGISLDLDALDPRDAPGVGVAVPGGIRQAELFRSLAPAAQDPCLVALEIVEYNPHRDRGGRTARLVGDIAELLLAGSSLEQDGPGQRDCAVVEAPGGRRSVSSRRQTLKRK